MKKITLENFMESTFIDDELIEALIKQSGLEFDEIVERIDDLRNPQNGIAGFIYYYETEEFAKDNLDEILMVINEYNEMGLEFKPDYSDACRFYNSITWFAWETFIWNLESYIDDNIKN